MEHGRTTRTITTCLSRLRKPILASRAYSSRASSAFAMQCALQHLKQQPLFSLQTSSKLRNVHGLKFGSDGSLITREVSTSAWSIQPYLPELKGRRTARADLIEDTFGHIVSLDLARQLLKGILERRLLAAHQMYIRDDIGEEVTYASSKEAMEAAEAACRGKPWEWDTFRWIWDTKSSSKVPDADFLNTIAATCMDVMSARNYKGYLDQGAWYEEPNPAHWPFFCPDISILPAAAYDSPHRFDYDLHDYLEHFEETEVEYRFCENLEGWKGRSNPFHRWVLRNKSARCLDHSYTNWTQIRLAAAIDPSAEYSRGYAKYSDWHLPKKTCFIRGDASGLEECTFQRDSSRGVLDLIRIALGITLSDDADLGADPVFEMQEDELDTATKPMKRKLRQRLGYRDYLEPKDWEVDPDLPLKLPLPARVANFWDSYDTTLYRSRYPAAIKLPNGRRTRRFSIHQLLYGSSYLLGDNTQVWSVTEDKKRALEQERLALKISWPKKGSLEVAQALSPEVRNIPNLILPKKQGILTQVGDLRVKNKSSGSELEFEDREQRWSIEKLMRPIDQFVDLEEIVDAAIDVLNVLIALHGKGIVHRDINQGSIVLQPKGLGRGGALRDMETAVKMLDTVHTSNEDVMEHVGNTYKPASIPYLAIDVLRGRTHKLQHDVESLFYTNFLFFFLNNGPTRYCPRGRYPVTRYPSVLDPPIRSPALPESLAVWTYGPNNERRAKNGEDEGEGVTDFIRMAKDKASFFNSKACLDDTTLNDMTPYWRDRLDEVEPLIKKMVGAVFANTYDGANPELTPDSFGLALQEWKNERANGAFPNRVKERRKERKEREERERRETYGPQVDKVSQMFRERGIKL